MLLKVYNDAISSATLDQVAKVLEDGGVIIYPTDTVYSIGCDALHVRALDRLVALKGIDPKKTHFSIVCRNLSQAGTYARVSNEAFRLIKQYTPGPFTFILPTSSALPHMYKGRREVGIRVPDHPVVQAIIDYYGSPLTGFSLPAPQKVLDEAYGYHPELIDDLWGARVDLVLDGGIGGTEKSAIIDCTTHPFTLLRNGPRPIEL